MRPAVRSPAGLADETDHQAIQGLPGNGNTGSPVSRGAPVSSASPAGFCKSKAPCTLVATMVMVQPCCVPGAHLPRGLHCTHTERDKAYWPQAAADHAQHLNRIGSLVSSAMLARLLIAMLRGAQVNGGTRDHVHPGPGPAAGPIQAGVCWLS